MRVALTRSSQAGAASAARLARLGFETAIAPAIAICATGARPPQGPFDALVATSANALTMLAPDAGEPLRRTASYFVGERTAQAAARLGFGPPRLVAPNVGALAARLVEMWPPETHALYLAGRDRARTLEETLAAAGHRVASCEIYAAEARAAWSEEEARAVAACGAALHYSPRSAELAARLAERAGLSAHFAALLHICISEPAAAPLRSIGAGRIFVAPEAREASLFETLAARVAG